MLDKIGRRQNRGDTLCWRCANAVPRLEGDNYVRGCSWSIALKPVKGWEAEQVRNRWHTDGVSYIVRHCPQFRKDAKK